MYGEEDEDGDPINMNGIRARNGYIMAKIYFEADLDNLFFRKKSYC